MSKLVTVNSFTGMIIPPTAANTGSTAARSRKSPDTNWRLSAMPVSAEKMPSGRSDAHSLSVKSMGSDSGRS
jgi:hypothetical protein